LFLTSCQANPNKITPIITPPPFQTAATPPSTCFPELKPLEWRQSWSKELLLANNFAQEADLYRAITCYKRALFLLPPEALERRREIEYQITLCYYLGEKYPELIDQFEKSSLIELPPTFPALDDLLIMLYDAYIKTEDIEKACRVLYLIEARDKCLYERLQLSTAISQADFFLLETNQYPEAEGLLLSYQNQAKSVRKAEMLNALLPGAGYLYVGQKQTALTSFVINALFIWAAYNFFDHGNIAAGIITSSLEFGWYFGGINGAGLSASQYNQRLYEVLGREYLLKQNLFPRFMIHCRF
jgi:hypothetical protein